MKGNERGRSPKRIDAGIGQRDQRIVVKSDRIASAIGDIKRSGYDVFLVLEATIGFNKRDGGSDSDDEAPEERTTFESAGTVKWTSQDAKFLKALRISMEEER